MSGDLLHVPSCTTQTAQVKRHFTLTLRLLMSYIQDVPGGKDLTSGECSLGQTIPI